MATGGRAVDTLIFDVDDTLYPVSSGFSKHRNGPIVARFMVDELGFESEAEALALRDEVFRATHSTLKGLTLASREGRLPKPFDEPMLGEYLCGNQPVRRVHWFHRAVRNRHRHAIEQASRRWRGGRRDDSARTRRKTLISKQESTGRRTASSTRTCRAIMNFATSSVN